MKEISLRLDLSRAVNEIIKRKARLVALQAPEGLKTRLLELSKEIESRTSAKVITFIEPCFGACDLKDLQAKALGAELLIHLGHSGFIEKEALPTIYLPLRYEGIELKEAIEKAALKLRKAKAGKIALCAVIQFIDYLPELKKMLEEKGFKAFIGKGDRRVNEGQVLGCNYSSVKAVEEKIDATVFLGDGLFHALGLAFGTGKPVLLVDALAGNAEWVDEKEKEKFLRKRYGLIAVAMNAKSFGLLVSVKPGQQNLKLALALKKKIEAKGLKAFILAADLIKPEYLLGLQIDCLVDLACPRIAVDDSAQYGKPVLSAKELFEVIEKI